VGFRHPPPTRGGLFRSPLHGLTIVVDPGHSPDPGAIGPTGLAEAEANLGIALELARILEKRGAEVVLTRATPDSGLGLYERTHLAVGAGGDLFVSIHNNALPDGVNPFRHNGTSVLWYHPQSEPLARAIQAELLPRTGLPDHGIWYQNLAVTRMTEMPAVLVEAAFMMIPGQEARLRNPGYRREIAEGVADGIERYLEGNP
jgi:N-acetylmuramoyl-L-alanine amidase